MVLTTGFLLVLVCAKLIYVLNLWYYLVGVIGRHKGFVTGTGMYQTDTCTDLWYFLDLVIRRHNGLLLVLVCVKLIHILNL